MQLLQDHFQPEESGHCQTNLVSHVFFSFPSSTFSASTLLRGSWQEEVGLGANIRCLGPELVGPRKTLIQLRNLCLNWLQPEIRTKEEIIELLVLEQYLTIVPERIKPWVQAKKPENCEKLVTLLENYKEMYEPKDDDVQSDDDRSRVGAESPSPRSVHSFCSDWDWRGRSRETQFRDHWPYTRTSRKRLLQHDLSLPLMEKTNFEMEGEDDIDRDSMMDFESTSQDAESYQDVVDLTEDRKPQDPVQDNMENYRKLLSLGVQLAEDDRHSHLTHGHSSRSKRSAYPSTSRGLKTMPEAKKSTHRRGICEDRSSHGVIMEKFIKDVSRNSKVGRARESNDWPQRFPRMLDDDWKDVSFSKRESVIQERGCEGSVLGGGFNLSSNLMSRKRVIERKRRYQLDTDGKGLVHNQKGYVRKKPFECSKMRAAVSMSSLSSLSPTKSLPADFGDMPYVCDECGRPFSVISEFVEHQIMHTRENLSQYGESFIHSMAVSEVQKRQARGKCFECKECGEAFNNSTTLTEHRKTHEREYLMECQDQEYEETFIPSPTLSELQKMYSKEKFYECRVCKETFLYSSALVNHQETHGRGNFGDDTDNECGEAFKPSPALNEFQKMYSKEKMYECKVCGETFLHSSALKEHKKIHARENPFENQDKMCEETFIPGQSLKRHQKTHAKEKLYEFKDGGDAFIQSSDLSEHLKIHSQKNLYEGRGYEKSVIHSVPFTESQKSHTITRPPDNEENERAFTISANPEEQQRFPTKESVCEGRRCERSVIHRLVFTDPQKSHSAAELSKPKVIAESTISSADAIQCQTAHAGESAYEGKVCGRSVIQSIVTAEPPRHHTGNELAECSNGESSIYISDFNRQQKIDARENPFEVAKYNKYTVIHSVSSAEPQNSPTVEGPSELKKDGESSAPNSHVREYQKARAKKKYIECCRDYKTSVIHSLPFGEPQNSHTNERFYKCQECGESFVHSSDLSKHQKIHDREKPSGSKMYERSVIRSLALTDPQTSYAEDCMRMQCKECGKYFATSEALGRHQKVYGRERFHGRTPFGSSVIRGVGFDESQKDESDDTIYECKDCGLGFAHFNEFEDHQKVHGREYLMDNRVCGPSVIQTCSFGDSHKSGAGDQLYECPQCGESFISNDFLFEHQKMHEMEPFFVGRQHNEAWMRRLPLPTIRKRRRSSKKSPPVSKTLRCQVCGQDFIHSSVLREHMKIHTGEDQLERGKTSEDTGAPGLALTEFQRSQAEEKNYECKTCGETFLSQPDLRDHMRVHEKDEPFNYGATFVHTSFVSELPNTSSPFYECKDCGKSFIHSTILVKHQQLHLEEAAQEVEANFVVPQEVLRIQGSNVEAAEPEVEAAEPEVEAAEPNLEAAEPNGEAEGPDGGAAGPDGEAEQPSGVAEPPRGDADEPDGAGIEDPEERAEDPEEDADEPDGAGIEDPEEEGGDQEIQVEEPYYDCRECAKTFTSSSAYGEHLKTHARVIIYEAGNVYGESSRYTEHASTSTSASDRADEKYFKCDVCGQLFRDRLSLARHQNSHTG
ncbi:paternally-expressed gene 3 protein isoform X2 [Loxodonta africana]|uniref:paternally-expressed gene 3 protein isoform X2 n=1 Tax=Loxodonta africana TaxID=9785 RepID=UPI0030D3AEC2